MDNFIILSIIIVSIVFIATIFFGRKPEKKQTTCIAQKGKSQTLPTQTSNATIHSIEVGSYCAVKYNFYPTTVFRTFQGERLYKNIVVNNLWIQEPFHTTFVTILKFYENNDDAVKSETTNAIKIKIARTNEVANAYKVYSVRELIFRTVDEAYEKIKHKYDLQDTQLILIAILLFKIDSLRSMSQIYKDIHNLRCEDILPIVWDSCSKLLQIINQIKDGEGEFDFINTIFQNSKKFALEYPYEDSNERCDSLLLSLYNPKIKKNLLSL